MSTTPERIAYGGWPTCYRLSNPHVDLVVTADVGPRIIRFGFVGQPNVFCEVPAEMGLTGGATWRIMGGHRLWHAPEHPIRTYAPDNEPVAGVVLPDGGLRVTQAVEASTGLQKSLEIRLAPDAPTAEIRHRLINRNLWAVTCAPWALSVMAAGGVGIFPLPRKRSHAESLIPAISLTLWNYSDMADPRWTWGSGFVMLRQQPGGSPQKVGATVPQGWAAYVNAGTAFVKHFPFDPSATYPDSGCNYETFTNDYMLELESLGPLVDLQPGASVEHVESWHLLDGVPTPDDEAAVGRDLLPRLSLG